jgi:hypothetical protein
MDARLSRNETKDFLGSEMMETHNKERIFSLNYSYFKTFHFTDFPAFFLSSL